MVQHQKIEKELGQILIEANLITEKQLKAALKRQKETGQCLAKNIIELGYVKGIDVAKCMAEQYKIPCVSLERYDLKEGLVSVIPENISNAYGVIPLDVIGNILTIGMIDTPGEEILKLLEVFTGFKIQVMLVTTGDFNKYMQRVLEASVVNVDRELENIKFGKYVKTKLYKGIEKRRFPRFSEKINVKYDFDDRHLINPSINVSRGGILVVSESPLPLDSYIKLKLELPTSPEDIIILSKVVRAERVEDENIYRIAFGFVGMNTESYERLVEFIKSF